MDAVQELNHECSLRQGDVCVSCMAALLGCRGIEHGTGKNRSKGIETNKPDFLGDPVYSRHHNTVI